ncbi:DUF4160 domain-containing protein [Spirosoma arboris]|nr:DUF4160 domain-containing protein [Spirosoma arboris]
MPKIYEYFGLIFLIYTNDHLPIHVHIQYAEYENKAELNYIDGELTAINFGKVKGKKPLPSSQRKEAEQFIFQYHLAIVEKWKTVMVLNQKPAFEKITQKV